MQRLPVYILQSSSRTSGSMPPSPCKAGTRSRGGRRRLVCASCPCSSCKRRRNENDLLDGPCVEAIWGDPRRQTQRASPSTRTRSTQDAMLYVQAYLCCWKADASSWKSPLCYRIGSQPTTSQQSPFAVAVSAAASVSSGACVHARVRACDAKCECRLSHGGGGG